MARITLWSPSIGEVFFPVAVGGIGSSLTQTRDPLTSDTGFNVGTVWFNSSAGALRWWECRASGSGGSGAGWVFSGADYANGGTNPVIEVTQFGQSTALMAEEGNIYREVIAGRNPGATNADNVIAVYTMPASAFDLTGRGVNLLAEGSVANNTNSKRIKIYWGCTTATLGSTVVGGTVIADTGAYTTAGAVGWAVEANVFKYGAAGSNTQLALHYGAQIGAVVGSLLTPVALTSTESASVIIAVTGNAVTATTDITQNFFEVNALN